MTTKAKAAKNVRATTKAARKAKPRVMEATAIEAVQKVQSAADDLHVTAVRTVQEIGMAAQETSENVRSIGERALEAVGKLTAKMDECSSDPGEKRLHRRIVIAVYDGEGVRMSNSSHDLRADQTLALALNSLGLECSLYEGSWVFRAEKKSA